MVFFAAFSLASQSSLAGYVQFQMEDYLKLLKIYEGLRTQNELLSSESLKSSSLIAELKKSNEEVSIELSLLRQKYQGELEHTMILSNLLKQVESELKAAQGSLANLEKSLKEQLFLMNKKLVVWKVATATSTFGFIVAAVLGFLK